MSHVPVDRCFGITPSDYLKKKPPKQRGGKEKARSNVYVTSHICSCNYFPVGCFQQRRKPDRTGIQQWITIHLLEISNFSEGGKIRGAQLILSMLPRGQQKNQMLGVESMFTDHSPGKESLENLPCELPTCVCSPTRHNNAKVTCQAGLLQERKTHANLTVPAH